MCHEMELSSSLPLLLILLIYFFHRLQNNMDKAQRSIGPFHPLDLYTILQHEQHFGYSWPSSLVVVDLLYLQNYGY